MKQHALKWLVLTALVCTAATAHALALSEIELNSLLNQPLDARVHLTGVEESDLAGLSIRIHEEADDHLEHGVALLHEVVREKGRYYLRIFSNRAVKEPAMRFTVEVSWTEGRYSREYSLLLDPQ